MKKYVSLLIVMMLLCSFIAIPCAFAEDDLRMTATPDPAELAAGGKISLKLELDNRGDAITQIKIKKDDKELSMIDSLAEGANVTVTIPNVEIRTDELGDDIEITAEYNYNGKTRTETTEFTIKEAEAAPACELAVAADKAEYTAGETAKLTFSIKNTGNIALLNCQVKDPNVDGGKNLAGAPFAIEAGKAVDIEYEMPVEKAAAISAAFTAEAGEEAFEKSFDPYQLSLVPAALEISAVTDKTEVNYGDEVRIHIELKNVGGDAMNGVVLKDQKGNAITLASQSILPGESLQAEYCFAAEMSEEFVFTATAGEYILSSEPLALTVNGGPVDPAAPLSLNVYADKTTIEKAGELNITISIENATADVYKDVVISERTLGEIEKLDELPAGTRAKITRAIDITGSSELEFFMTAVSPDGVKVEFTSTPLFITVIGGSNLNEFFSNLTKGDNIFLLIIGIIAIVVIGLIIALICVSKAEKKEKENGKAEEKEELSYVSREAVSRNSARPSRRRRRYVEPAEEAAEETVEAPEEAAEETVEETKEEAFVPAASLSGWSVGFEEEEEKELTHSEKIDEQVRKMNEDLEFRLEEQRAREVIPSLGYNIGETEEAVAEEAPIAEEPEEVDDIANIVIPELDIAQPSTDLFDDDDFNFDDIVISEEDIQAEIAKIMAERAAEEARLEAERLAAEEAARLEAERLAAEEAARLEAERLAAEEAARLEAERLAAEEAARLEAERLAAEEAARREAARKARAEAIRQEAIRRMNEAAEKRRAAEEAERIAAEEAAKREAEARAAKEAAMREARKKAVMEAARREAERRIAMEAAAKAEAEKAAAEAAAKAEAEKAAAKVEAAPMTQAEERRLAAEKRLEALRQAEALRKAKKGE
ncbi:MAG: DUF11 domain-containing protein [Clostridiales bacterium]|nr:DUF11 domain-containing protein [Clostridiales bacterium]